MTHTMEPPRSTGGTPVTSTSTALDELSALLPGQVTRPGEPAWDQVRLGFNLAVEQEPTAVVTAVDEEDVVATVRWANRYGASVTAQPVGHGATRATDGAVLLRTRELREIAVDPERRVARVGAGAKWGEVLAATAPYGLTGLAGSSPDPTVAGFSLSGGLSWFGRAYGAGGAQHRRRRPRRPVRRTSLGHCGEQPGAVLGAARRGRGLRHRGGARDRAAPGAARLRRAVDVADRDGASGAEHVREGHQAGAGRADALDAPAAVPAAADGAGADARQARSSSIEATYLGAAEEAERLLEPFRTIPAMWADTMDTVQLSELGAICAEPEEPLPAMEYSSLLTDFDDVAVEALRRAVGADSGSPLVVVQLRHLGGAFARGTADAGPVGAVSEPYQLFELGVPMAPELVPAIQAAFARTRDELAPYLSARTSFTFLGSDDDPRRAFSDEALGRLQEIKRRVDPNGVIRSNRPVLRGLEG